MNKVEASQVRDRLEADLKEQHPDANVVVRSTWYTDTGEVRLTVTIKDDGAKQVEWDLYKEMLDLPPDAIGKTFTSNGKTFKIIGLNARKAKKPVMLESGGKTYYAPVAMIRAGLV